MHIMTRILLLCVVLIGVIVAIWYLEGRKIERGEEQAASFPRIVLNEKNDKASKYESAKEISTPDGFINRDSITVGEFVGKKVVLLDIWTYSCINCQRTLPYLKAWHEKYADKGLVIIGLHTPEFEFEKKYDNVLEAVKRFSIPYPVVLDNDYSTWTAYGNRYWPRKYLIDIDGFIVYDHIGEGGYEETENKIRELLVERKIALGETGEIDKDMAKPENVQDVSIRPESPEVYFGASRNELFANGDKSRTGIQDLASPSNIVLN